MADEKSMDARIQEVVARIAEEFKSVKAEVAELKEKVGVLEIKVDTLEPEDGWGVDSFPMDDEIVPGNDDEENPDSWVED